LLADVPEEYGLAIAIRRKETMMLSKQRSFVSPEPGEDWNGLAARILKDEPAEAAVEKLKSWNLHLFARVPPGEFLGSDVIFTEPPRASDASSG